MPNALPTRALTPVAIIACFLVGGACILVGDTCGAEKPVVKLPRTTITLLPPGTKVVNGSDRDRWNRSILLATPKISGGDVAAISDLLRDSATRCTLTILATVNKEDAKQFELVDLGIGYSVPTEQGRVIVSADTESEQSASLGLIGRQILRRNEKQLREVTVIARSSTAVVFDAAAVLNRRGKHRRYLVRHLVLLDDETGDGKLITWLLAPVMKQQDPPNAEPSAPVESATYPIINRPARVSDWGTREVRNIHVDGEAFGFFGIPGATALALEDLPPGRDIPWTRALAESAGNHSFSRQELRTLSSAFRAALISNEASAEASAESVAE
jgi:hypothetical protein